MVMARLGYIRCRRKQDIEEFKVVSQADEVFIDLVNELGESGGNALKETLDKLNRSDTLVIRNLREVADTVSDLRHFLSTIRELQVELVLLESNNQRVISDEGFETLLAIKEFIEEKERLTTLRQKKIGRPIQTFPPDFYKVYTEYKSGAYNSTEAAARLSIHRNRLRELIRIFEA